MRLPGIDQSDGAIAVFVYMAICVAQIGLRRQHEQAGEPLPAIRDPSDSPVAGIVAALLGMTKK